MKDQLFSVENKNIIVTGSSGLLGSAYSRALLERGANMALIDINTRPSENIKKEFQNSGKKIAVYKCDLSRPSNIKTTFRKMAKDFHTIDVLINNAAFTSRQTFHIKNFKDYEKHPLSMHRTNPQL